jgi:hypothetical protein
MSLVVMAGADDRRARIVEQGAGKLLICEECREAA